MTIIVPTPTTTQTQIEPIEQLLETAALYLHIPFCHTRCYYCDFNTYAGMLPMREPYVRALLTEIALAGQVAQYPASSTSKDTRLMNEEAGGEQVPMGLRRSRTIFFGGGTPS